MTAENLEVKNLSLDEQARLDELFQAARRFHHLSFLLTGISFALASMDVVDDIVLPFGNISMPHVQSIVGIYILVISMNLAARRLFYMAFPWQKMDRRRPPFAWIALGSGEPSKMQVQVWLTLPILLCAISTATSLSNDSLGVLLSFVGVFALLLPTTVTRYWTLIQEKSDHRGGEVTLSVYLLYWYRMIGTMMFVAVYFVPILAIIPKWRERILMIGTAILVSYGTLYVIRLLAGLPFVYKRIDRLGNRYGFSAQSRHYS